MRYTQELQKKVVERLAYKTQDEIAKEFKIPVSIVAKWSELNLPDEKLRYTVRQKFYNIFPILEAKITSTFSDYLILDITDEEWEGLSKMINKNLFDFAYKIYKSSLLETKFYEYAKNETEETLKDDKPKAKGKKCKFIDEKDQLLFGF